MVVQDIEFEKQLYNEFVAAIHWAGLSTAIHSINECFVFRLHTNISIHNDYIFEHIYLGRFKFQNWTVFLFPAERITPQHTDFKRHPYQKLDDLSDPEIIKKVLRFFNVEDWQITEHGLPFVPVK